jgi:hypothetical protein
VPESYRLDAIAQDDPAGQLGLPLPEQFRYMHSFTAPVNPARVTYERDMPFERATERSTAAARRSTRPGWA